jgi:DNA-binding CsgD family transcriptional regulator
MLIGRRRELDVLTQCLADVHAAGGPVVLISGEAGIGKTTLLHHLRDLARERGLAVAAEVSREGGWSPPYAPWVAVLEQLGQPVSLIAARSDDVSPDDHHYRVRRSVLGAIEGAAAVRPVVILLDDLQWMDQLSREVLLHVIQGLGSSRVLLVGTVRTPVPEREVEVRGYLATLHRVPGVRWLEIGGLDAPEVGKIVQHLGWAASTAEVRHLTGRTRGNPFFVAEIARLAGEDGDRADREIPSSVRAVVQARLEGLAEPVGQVLRMAALFSRGFDFRLVREMSEMAEDHLLDALDVALDADFLRAGDQGPESYQFSHEIVREVIAAGWSPSRRARLHRKAAEALKRVYAGSLAEVFGDLAFHYYASRSLPGAERGIAYARESAERALQLFDHAQAAELLGLAKAMAVSEPASVRAEIAWKRALALAESLQVDEAVAEADQAVTMLGDAGVDAVTLADVCWRMAHAFTAVGASMAARNRLQRAGLEALGERRDIHWARLRLLTEPIEVVPNDELYAARWVGYDPEAQRIARQSGLEEDHVQTIESFDARTPDQTRSLIVQARGWRQPRATLRGLTAAGNDLTYRHGEFRTAMAIWNEVLETARRVGTIPWQANALNQITLLHVTLGEFEAAVGSKRLADEANAVLGPANDAEALLMERDFALTHYLDGDWTGQAAYWLRFIAGAPQGLEAQLAVPLYAAMAASAAAVAGVETDKALRIIDALAQIARYPGIQQVNGVVALAAGAVARLGAADRAHTYDRLAEAVIALGMGDYPQTSLFLTRARMLNLLGDARATGMFERARETLASQDQQPLLGIALYEQAMAGTTPLHRRAHLLGEAMSKFERLGMTAWHERAVGASATPVKEHPDLAGLSRREREVLKLVAQGYSDRRVADALFISERTVNAHLRNMLGKTGKANRTELSAWAMETGILGT